MSPVGSRQMRTKSRAAFAPGPADVRHLATPELPKSIPNMDAHHGHPTQIDNNNSNHNHNHNNNNNNDNDSNNNNNDI